MKDINALTTAETQTIIAGAFQALEAIRQMAAEAIAERNDAAVALVDLDGERLEAEPRSAYWDALKKAHCTKGHAAGLQDALQPLERALAPLSNLNGKEVAHHG